MLPRSAQLDKIAPRHIRVQAAVWVTDLHGPDRDANLEARVRQWIAEDPRHAAAFELATEAWQRSGDLPAPFPKHASYSKQTRSRARLVGPVLAGAAVICGVLMATAYFLRDGALATGPGEQRTVELGDGTRIVLNANTRVLPQYDDRVRKVTLAAGEALFDVAKHQQRPFVVVTGDRKVIALGTSFTIRREVPTGTAFAVTLLEGRVAVEPLSWPDALPTGVAPGLTILNPGERLRFERASAGSVDSPSIDKVTAWQRGELIFDDTSLSQAAGEFNRYGPTRITIDSSTAGRVRTGGVFRIGDPSSFALAMANAYHLRIITRGNEIILTDKGDDRK
jgi:transmembrane sensor